MEKDKDSIKLLNIVGIVLIVTILFSGPLFVLGLSMFHFSPSYHMGMMHGGYSDEHDHHSMMSMEDSRLAYIEHGDAISDELRDEGNYECCLLNPCTYCIEKTPGHGEGASCHCLDDIMNGEHPCGECMGEILEGHGNKHAAMYFASAIADELGVEYLDMLKEIIAKKYNISVDEQF
ncbi:MAG: hypothetical protein ACKKL6_00100 [Candidatus Komeilibacteria bacterium]